MPNPCPSALVPLRLKANNLENPLGLGKGAPELSWCYEGCQADVRQTHWQIRAAATPEVGLVSMIAGSQTLRVLCG